mgnify:CR=1 FL=1
MKHFITALAILATPAAASTVALDPGDRGLVWTAEGFRPVDGIDVFTGKFSCPRVGPAWKDMAQDRVQRATQCATTSGEAVTYCCASEGLRAGPRPSLLMAWHRTPPRFDVPPLVPLWPRCCRSSPPPETPPAPVVPLPGSLWLLAVALAALFKAGHPR